MPSYLDELFAPLDLLPARYHRKPQPVPDPQSQPIKETKNTFAAKVREAAHAAHTLHYKMWDEFAASLARLLHPHPDLSLPVLDFINEFNIRFAAPLAEVGWQT